MGDRKRHTLAPWAWPGLFLALWVLVLAIAVPASVHADGVVHFYYFYDPTCPVCQGVHREVIVPLVAEYGERIAIDERDMSDPATFEFLLALEKQFAVTDASIPEVFIGQDALIGNDPIRERLRERVDYYLTQGGVALPIVAGLVPPTKAPTGVAANVTPSPVATSTAQPSAGGPAIHLAWFYDPGCDLCERKEHDLNYILGKYPQVKAQRFNSEEETALFQYLCLRANVPEDRQLVAPALFVGDAYLVGQEISGGTIEALIQPYLSSGAAEPWAGYQESKEVAETTIVDRFRSLGLLTVVGAGLIDGINPCAFATMIFLVSYLSVRKRRGRELLATGAAFTAGVFLAYLGLGLGFLKFLTTIPILNIIGKWIYGLTMLLCLGLAWGSFADYLKARQGRLEDMSLKLPSYLRGLERRLIREGTRARNFVLAAFGLGFVVAVVELACTGQVYLPTIIFVLGLPDWRARATLALVVYNLMFILPLVAVFLLVYFGTTSQQLTGWMQRRAAAVKLGMAVLFLLLAAWLGYSIISV
jgi:cytochrome c biogenesis protein CcdA